jgi:hypothetical protein
MKFNNAYNLPAPLVKALIYDDYDLQNPPENVVSLTTLIAPTKQKVLERRHESEVEVDVSERLWSVFGRACHGVVENATQGHFDTETRWYMNVSKKEVFISEGDVTENPNYNKDEFYVSGKFDVYDAKAEKLSDYKVTSIWSWLIEKGIKPEHDAQLQVNGLAVKLLSYVVKELSVIMMFRDWSKSKSRTDYPELPIPFKEIVVSPWPEEAVWDFLRSRIKAWFEAYSLPDDKIPECNDEERWARASKWAIMKPGQKKAVKLFPMPPTAAELREYPGYKVEERHGEDIRCNDYCSVKMFCHYFRDKNLNTEGY